MDSRITRHDEVGKDYNAKAMTLRNTEQIRQQNGYTGMETRQPRRNLTEILQGTQKLKDSGQPQQS